MNIHDGWTYMNLGGSLIHMIHLQCKSVQTIPMLAGNSALAASTGVIWSTAIFTNWFGPLLRYGQKSQNARGK